MPTIIDSLLIEIGLDPKGLKKGQKESVEELRKLEAQSNKTSKGFEEHGKKMGNALHKVRNQVLGLITAFTAGAGIKSFYTQMTNTDTAAGRLAVNLGMSVEQLTAWQGVAERSGGSAEGIAGTMQNLTQQFQQLALTGQSAVIPYFRAVGVSISDLTTGKMRPLNDILLDLSDKFSRMDPTKAQALGRGMGLDEGTVNVLIKGRSALQAMLIQQERLGHANKEDTDAAIRRTEAWRRLVQVSENLGRKFLTLLTPALEKVDAWLEKIGIWFGEHPKVANAAIGSLIVLVSILSAALSIGLVGALGGVGAAGVGAFGEIAAAAAPVLAFVAAIAAVAYAIPKGLDWLKSRKGFQTRNFGAKDAWEAADGSDKSGLPRGIRNNNPGNLNYAGQAGASKEGGAGGRFAVFGSMEEGVVALAKQLHLYSSRGIDSIRKIIEKYAPKSENDTQAYLNAISRKMGIDPDAKLNLKDQGTLQKLIEGISTHENGKGYLAPEVIKAALSGRGGAGSGGGNRAETHIGKIEVYTRATDAKGIAGSLGGAITKHQNMAAMADYGIS